MRALIILSTSVAMVLAAFIIASENSQQNTLFPWRIFPRKPLSCPPDQVYLAETKSCVGAAEGCIFKGVASSRFIIENNQGVASSRFIIENNQCTSCEMGLVQIGNSQPGSGIVSLYNREQPMYLLRDGFGADRQLLRPVCIYLDSFAIIKQLFK